MPGYWRECDTCGEKSDFATTVGPQACPASSGTSCSVLIGTNRSSPPPAHTAARGIAGSLTSFLAKRGSRCESCTSWGMGPLERLSV